MSNEIQLQDLACGHEGMISSICFSPDGKTLGSSSLDKTARIWSLTDTEKPKIISEHKFNVTHVGFAANGQSLATSSDDRRVLLWAFPNLQPIGELDTHPRGVTRLAFSPNNRDLVTCANDRRIRIWAINGTRLGTLEGHVSLPRSIAFSPQGNHLISGSEGGTLRIWKMSDLTPGAVLYGHRGGVNQIVWQSENSIISASDDTDLRVWNPQTGECLHILSAHTGPIKALAISSCGRLLASRSWDQTLRLWRTDDYSPVAIIEEDTAAPYPNLAFHPNQPILASVGAVDRAVRLWHLNIDALATAPVASQVLSFRDQEVALLIQKGFEELASAPPRRKKKPSPHKVVSVPVDVMQHSPLAAPPSRTTPPTFPPQPTPQTSPPTPAQQPPQVAPIAQAAPAREVTCNECGEAITERQASRRKSMGFNFINCPVCENRVSLSEDGNLTLHDWAGTNKLILAVMFTDIVDSSRIANALGNQAMSQVRHQHFDRVRLAIRAHRGFEIKTIGDSFMACFKTVSDGLSCAIDVLRNTGHNAIAIRSSLHVGPVEVEEHDLFGNMVNFCARLMSQADGSELCISEEAHSHVVQEGDQRHLHLPWQAHENVAFKGFTGAYRVWTLPR